MKWFVYIWFLFITVIACLLVIGMTMNWLQGGISYV